MCARHSTPVIQPGASVLSLWTHQKSKAETGAVTSPGGAHSQEAGEPDSASASFAASPALRLLSGAGMKFRQSRLRFQFDVIENSGECVFKVTAFFFFFCKDLFVIWNDCIFSSNEAHRQRCAVN